MMRILFVDDEPRILDGLRRMLHLMRHEWEMRFAESGAAALELLAQGPFDVVVSDMRMPGMSGVELLSKIKEKWPGTVRIVLSGYAEKDAVMQAFGVTQQYLVKPTDQLTLQRTVNRSLAIKALLGSDNVKKLVGGLSSLPALPEIYQELVTCLRSPEASLADVGEIIGRDVGMTADMLKIVNSAYFGLPKAIATIERAVSFLGLDTVMTLTLQHGVFGKGKPRPAVPGFDASQLQRNSLRAAATARAIARTRDSTAGLADEAFLVGVLHDIGKLVLADGLPERYAAVSLLAHSERLPWHEAERRLLGTTHAEAGAFLLGLWGFSDQIVEAVLFHAEPSRAEGSEWGLAGLVHVACALTRHPDCADPGDPALGLESGYLERVGLAAEWPAWQQATWAVLEGGTRS